jgi:hypothetical protein
MGELETWWRRSAGWAHLEDAIGGFEQRGQVGLLRAR